MEGGVDADIIALQQEDNTLNRHNFVNNGDILMLQKRNYKCKYSLTLVQNYNDSEY